MLDCRRTRRQPRREKGAAAVEFALILPVLAMFLFGTITAGFSYTHAIGVTNAVREGARLGATADTASGSWADDVIKRVRSTQFDDSTDVTSSTTAVCVDLVKLNPTKTAWLASTISGTSKCSSSSSSPSAPNAPSLGASSAPNPPADTANLTAGTCVVRVWAARDFQISIIIAPVWKGTAIRTSVARYERLAC